METFTLAFLQLLLVDVFLDQVNIWTVRNAERYLAKCKEDEKFEWVLVLAGAPDNVDYKVLRRLAVEELIRQLEGKFDDLSLPVIDSGHSYRRGREYDNDHP